MRRRIALTFTVATAAGLTLAASASANVYCLPGVTDPSCTNSSGTIDAAFSSANSSAGADTVRLGTGTYSIANPAGLSDGGGAAAIHVIGAGKAATTITGTNAANSAQTYLTLGSNSPSSISNLTIQLPPASSNESTDTALTLFTTATADDVAIVGPSADNGKGLNIGAGGSFTNGSITLPHTSTLGAGISGSGATISDTTITANGGIDASNNVAQAPLISRVTLRVNGRAIYADGGNVDVDDTLIDLMAATSAVGIDAVNFNNGSLAKTINARHVTIVGGGGNSIGVRSSASASGAAQTSTVNLADSVIAGPTISLSRLASNSVAGTSTANITTDHSNYDAATVVSTNGNHGAGSIAATAQTNSVPGFTDPGTGDYSLTASSALVDAGNPATGGPAADRAGAARITDGDGDGTAVRDVGAYEYQPPAVIPDPPDDPNQPQAKDTTPPDTAFSKAPERKLKGGKLTAHFTSTEPGSTFECRLDELKFAPCSNPLKLRGVKRGKHELSVRAVDSSGNVDPTPAVARFKRVRKAKR